MGIRFLCPSGHKLNVKSFLAGKRAICPQCGAKVVVPGSSESQDAALSQQAGSIVTDPFAGVAGAGDPSPLDSASPSVIISVAPSHVTVPPAVANAPGAPAAVSNLPAPTYISPPPLLAAAEPDATTSEVQRKLRRDTTRQTQMAIAVVLFMLVIVLAGILIWVLQRNAGAPVEEESKAVSAIEPVAPHVVAAKSSAIDDRLTAYLRKKRQ